MTGITQAIYIHKEALADMAEFQSGLVFSGLGPMDKPDDFVRLVPEAALKEAQEREAKLTRAMAVVLDDEELPGHLCAYLKEQGK